MEVPEFQYPYSNCLLIKNGDNYTLVDSSPAPEEGEGLKQKKIGLILNSHGHFDHVSMNRHFPGAKVLLHPADHELVASGESYLEEFGFGLFPDEMMRSVYLGAIGYQERPADGFLAEGDEFDLGTTRLRTWHLPGHCAGHCGFWFPEEGIMFSADIDLNSFGPWYANIHSDIDQYTASINRVMEIRPEAVITGHGPSPVTKNITQRLLKYRDIIFSREKRIVELLQAGPKTIGEMAAEKPVYRKFPEPRRIFHFYECLMIYKHLERLEKLGRVEKKGETFYLTAGIRSSNLHLG